MIISISGRIGSGKDTIGKIVQYLLYMSIEQKGRYYPYDVFIEEIDTVNFHGSVNWEIKKFADKLKEIVCLLLGCTRAQLEDREFKEKELGEEWWYRKMERRGGYGTTLLPYNTPSEILENYRGLELVKLTPRLMLQLLGTDCGRDIIHPNIWVNSLFSEYLPAVTYQMEMLDLSATDLQREKIGKPIHSEYPDWIITDTRFPNEIEAVKERKGITIRVVRPVACVDINGVLHTLSYEDWIKIKQSEQTKGWIFPKEHASETALDKTTFDYTIENNTTIEELINKVKQILITEKII
jgi:hypothetical protein